MCSTALAQQCHDLLQAYLSPQSLETFAEAMTQNAQVSEDQALLFELYKSTYLKSSRITRHRGESFLKLQRILNENPGLKKKTFKEQIITYHEKEFKGGNSLDEFVKSFSKSTGRVKANFTQPEANLGFWKKVIQFKEREIPSHLDKEKKKALKERNKDLLFKQLKHLFSVWNGIQGLKDDSYIDGEYRKSAGLFFQRLTDYRDWMIKRGKNTRFISQVIIDLVHTVGLGNKAYKESLKDPSPEIKLLALKGILNEREIFSKQISNMSFPELLKHLDVSYPTGLHSSQTFSDTINDLEQDLYDKGFSISSSEEFRLRALSLQESPYRSCLGGHDDCSSDMYFDTALDPNFIYFTLTDKEHYSDGHMTFVLGTAKNEQGEDVKIAFLDKVQHVPLLKIKIMLEAIRKTLKLYGYSLGFPVDSGTADVLSNKGSIVSFIDQEITKRLSNKLTGFQPHENDFKFDKRTHTRAYQKLDLLLFDQEGEFNDSIAFGSTYPQMDIDPNLRVHSFHKEFIDLKDSHEEEDQLEFLNGLLDLGVEQTFIEESLLDLLTDPKRSFKVRKLSFLKMIQIKYISSYLRFLDIYSTFSPEEQQDILGDFSNWSEAKTHYKKDFINNSIYSLAFQDLKNALEGPFRKLIDINAEFGFRSSFLNMAIDSADRDLVEFILNHKDFKQIEDPDLIYNALLTPAYLFNENIEITRIIIESDKIKISKEVADLMKRSIERVRNETLKSYLIKEVISRF